MAEPKVLFTITEAHLNTGLRGFPVGTCRSSLVDPHKGVSYVGYPIAELADLEPEQVAYLLLHRELPSDAELAEFSADLKARRGISGEVITLLQQLPNGSARVQLPKPLEQLPQPHERPTTRPDGFREAKWIIKALRSKRTIIF